MYELELAYMVVAHAQQVRGTYMHKAPTAVHD